MNHYHHFAACDVSDGPGTHNVWVCGMTAAVCPGIRQAQFQNLFEPIEAA